MKIFYNGKQVRNWNGQYAPSLSKRRIKIVRNIILMAGLVLLSMTYTSFKVTRANSIQSENFEAKVEALKDSVVSDIINCETPGKTENDAPILLDSNKQMSIGRAMYQITTVQHYIKRFEGRDITRKEAVLIALNESEARELTKKIIFEDSKGWKNWLICGQKIGAEGRVKIIKELQ